MGERSRTGNKETRGELLQLGGLNAENQVTLNTLVLGFYAGFLC